MNNEDQIQQWNGPFGQKWTDYAVSFDEMFAPFDGELLSRVDPGAGDHVFDIGCGAGALTVQAAALIGETGSATGVDISAPLIETAKARAAASGSSAIFIEGDAHTFDPAQPIDKVVSRFGSSYFSHSSEFFAGLHAKMSPGGKLASSSWKSLLKNPWARVTFETSIPFLKEMPPLPPIGTPGPFAFAGKDWLTKILEETGWKNVEIDSWTDRVLMHGDTIRDIAVFLLELGPTARMLLEQGSDPEPAINALEKHLTDISDPDGSVYLGASAWIVSATAS